MFLVNIIVNYFYSINIYKLKSKQYLFNKFYNVYILYIYIYIYQNMNIFSILQIK